MKIGDIHVIEDIRYRVQAVTKKKVVLKALPPQHIEEIKLLLTNKQQQEYITLFLEALELARSK